MDIQNNTNNKTATQNEPQFNETFNINEELHELNRTLKEISDTLIYISQYGILTKG